MLLDENSISKLIRELKLSSKRVYSNCFLQFRDAGKEWEVFLSLQSILIVNKDNGVLRLLFYTADFDDLKELMDTSLLSDCEYILEIVAKDKMLYHDELTNMGFRVLAQMSRLSVKDISPLFEEGSNFCEPYDDSLVELANVKDIQPLKMKLWNIFDTRISHLPNEDELRSSIEKGEFCLYRDGNSDILAFLQSVIEPKSFYINQVYNGTEKKAIHSIMHKRLSEYYLNGGRYVYAWVDEENIASLKFHEKYGLKPDGLWTCVYMKEKKQRK